MVYLYLVPKWFFGYDVLFELAFALITLFVSFYAFRVYKLSEQNQSKLFGISFLFISISYFVQAFLNFAIISKLNEDIRLVLKINTINTLVGMEIYAHMIFVAAGLITLAYMTLKVKSAKLYSLLLVTILLSLFFSSNKLYMFYLLSSILLIYIFIHYLVNYFNKKKIKTLLVVIAFAFLLFGKIHFMFSVNHEVYYAIGHFLELIAYLLILINLVLVLRKK